MKLSELVVDVLTFAVLVFAAKFAGATDGEAIGIAFLGNIALDVRAELRHIRKLAQERARRDMLRL